MKKLKVIVLLSLAVVTFIMMGSCKKTEADFEIGFNILVSGEKYYIGSHIAKSLEELDTIVGEFEFSNVFEKYNKNFFVSKSIIIFSFHISGGNQREIENITLDGNELVVKYVIHSYPGTGGMYSEIVFIEVDRKFVTNAISVRGEL